MKIAMIGLGGMGSCHLTVYESMKNVEIVGLVDIRESVRADLAKRGYRTYATLDQLFANETMDYLDICTPSYLHETHALEAMKHHVHVLCEKPASLTEESAEKMRQCADDHHVLLMIAHVIRFWPEYQFLKKCFDNGCFGHLLQANFSRISTRPRWSWEDWMSDVHKSGKVPMDLYIHDADFILHLMGNPKEISADYLDQNGKINYLNATYYYDNTTIFSEAAWYESPIPFSMTYRAVFEKAIVTYMEDTLTVYEENKDPVIIQPEDIKSENTGININTLGAYKNEIEYFIDCLQNGKKPTVCMPESSINSIKIVEQILHAAHSRKHIII